MKFYITMPDGRELYFEVAERKPMDKDRFEALCWLVGVIAVLGLMVFGFSRLF